MLYTYTKMGSRVHIFFLFLSQTLFIYILMDKGEKFNNIK